MTKPSAAAIDQYGDEKLLAQLGYKQEFKRAFTPLEVHRLLLCPSRGSHHH